MIEPTLVKVVAVLFVLGGLARLLGMGQDVLSSAEYRRQQREERERKRKEKQRWEKLRMGCSLVGLLPIVLVMVALTVSDWLRCAASSGGQAVAVQAPSMHTPLEPLEPLPATTPAHVGGRPAHLLGSMADGCQLLTLEEAATLLGHPLKHDAFSLLLQRDRAFHCAFVDPSAHVPQRSRQEVSLQVLHRPEAEASAGPSSPRPEDLPWQVHDVDEGVSVKAPAGRGLQVYVRVSLRHLKRQPGKRVKAEREAAGRIALFVLDRVAAFPVEAATAVRFSVGRPPGTGGWFPDSLEDVVWQNGYPSARTWYTAFEPLYTLRARFGTRVKVVVLDDTPGPGDVELEALARAVERAYQVGPADSSPRRDGALVLVDPASHRAWVSFGPGAPPLTSSANRPFPTQWTGKDLTVKGPGLARRLQALTEAYTRAYAALGVEGPPVLTAASP